MGSSERQSGQNQNSLATLDPTAAGLANLFGGTIRPAKGGGSTTYLPRQILPQAFTPESFGDLGSLTNTLNPVNFDLSQIAGQGQGAMNTLGEAAATGLIGPAQDLFGQLFNERISGLQEQFGGFGLGPNDSDFQAAALREAQLGSTQLADLAQNRRLQAAGMFPDSLAGILDLEGQARAAERGRTPGGQQLDLLMTLGGMDTEAGAVGTERNRQSRWASIK
jgi:hypothetical protein